MFMRRCAPVIAFLISAVVLAAQSPSVGTAQATRGAAIDDEDLRIALVQYAVRGEDYRSFDTFSERVGTILESTIAHHRPDVVVFPEYTSVFALFGEYLTGDGELVPEVRALVAGHGIPSGGTAAGLSGEPVDSPLVDLVRREALRDEEPIRAVWSRLARTHRVWIVAGSLFVVDEAGELRNRAWVFSPDGAVAYQQDKVFLTPFERDLIGIQAGPVEGTRTFTVDGFDVSLTICRDSYFEVWERRFDDADVWMDIRANGEIWNDAVRRRFDTALPERIANTRVEWGVSTSLNGRFADLIWQGPAFVVDDDGERIRQSPVIDGDHVLVHDIPADDD